MARYEQQWWGGASAPSRDGRRAGTYEAYIPDPLMGRTLSCSTDTAALLSRVERAVAQLGRDEKVSSRGDISGLLLRTEAAASSWIEGIPPRSRQVAFAELAMVEDLRSPSETATLVARNIAILRTAVSDLGRSATLTVPDLVALQCHLVTDDRQQGLRSTQNWIGGNPYHPLDAAYVPPPPDLVPRLLDDLTAFMTGSNLPALVQAALAHAQLEIIHPFPDGNGRVGRALIHTVLVRRGLMSHALLPISLVLMTRKADYLAGLTAYRHVGPRDGAEAMTAADAWLQVFLRAVIDAVDQIHVIAGEVAALRADWQDRLLRHRSDAGVTRRPRSDSAVVTLLDGLLEAPVMTNWTAERLFEVSQAAASVAFSELESAGITRKRRERQLVVHFAPELLDLIDVSERRLASPEFDTRAVPPVRPVPTRGPVVERGNGERTISAGPGWSERAWSVWGKTDKDGSGEIPLVRHLEDAAAVAGELWDHWLPSRIRDTVSDGLPDGDADGRRLLVWAAGLHDIGKATPGFALKALYQPGNDHLLARMADQGLTCPPFVKGVPLPPHCHLGQYVLSQWLTARFGCGANAAAALSAPVGMHHGVPPGDAELLAFRGSQWTGHRTDAWREVQGEIIGEMARRTGMDQRLPDLVAHPPSESVQVLLTAVVVVADWLASDTLRFPPRDPRPLRERLRGADLEDALRSPWEPPAAVASASEMLGLRFPRLAGRAANDLQEQAHAAAIAMEEAGLMVIEAPMGSGKTEAALMAAEELARKFGAGGIFIALPTMATSDAMFGRVLDWTRTATHDAPATVFLAHGKARLNEDYAVLLRDRNVHVRGINEAEGDDSLAQRAAQATVTSWLQGRRKGVLANIVVGTIDQVLFGALRSRHVALRHLGLAGKVVIVDEVHAADAYMRRYLARVLEWLGSYGTPVILLSATLPRDHLDDLTAAYARGKRGELTLGGGRAAYPRLTVQTSTTRQLHVPWTGAVTEVDLVPVSSDLDALVSRVSADVEAGGCAVVIRNTVRRAQETYAALVAVLGRDRVVLLHSQFVASDRAAKERDVVSRLGPPGPGVDRPEGFVVVGTQVLEQSLDIDADVMETDHAPVDLLLQRIGRLHRHQRAHEQGDRPASLRRAKVRVMGSPSTSEVPNLDRGSEAVYGTYPLLSSAAVLAPHAAGKPLRLPDDIPTLVESAYDEQLAPPQAWESEWEEAGDRQYESDLKSGERARTYRLREPGARASLVGWLDGAGVDSEEGAAGRAQVRDTEDTLEVLLVWQDEAGAVRVLPGVHEHSGADLGETRMGAPSTPLALSVLASSVRLPHRITSRGRIDAVIRELEVAGWQFSGWQGSHWLSGQLILVLDADLRAQVGGEAVRYDADLGLVVEERGRRE